MVANCKKYYLRERYFTLKVIWVIQVQIDVWDKRKGIAFKGKNVEAVDIGWVFFWKVIIKDVKNNSPDYRVNIKIDKVKKESDGIVAERRY